MTTEESPFELGGGRVLSVAKVEAPVRATGNTNHVVDGQALEPVDALAICASPNESGVFLFYCNREWQVLADTWHMSVAEAKAQAEFEYAGVSEVWKDAV